MKHLLNLAILVPIVLISACGGEKDKQHDPLDDSVVIIKPEWSVEFRQRVRDSLWESIKDDPKLTPEERPVYCDCIVKKWEEMSPNGSYHKKIPRDSDMKIIWECMSERLK